MSLGHPEKKGDSGTPDHPSFRVAAVKSLLNLDSPEKSINMMFVHPHLSIEEAAEGYSLSDECRARQEKIVRHCLGLAANRGGANGPPIRFLVLPEFALPRHMLDQVEEMLSNERYPRNSVVISGVECVTKDHFAKLLQESDNPSDTKTLRQDSSTFVNFCGIWVKDSVGTVTKFVQPKLKGSATEQATQSMYGGDYVLLFDSDVLPFINLICFDCIAEVPPGPNAEGILEQIGAMAPQGCSRNLGLTFVIQHNPSPEHDTFIEFAHSMLHKGGLRVGTREGAVAFVNSSATEHGRARGRFYFGRSGFYYAPGRWQPVPDKGPITRVPKTYALDQPAHLAIGKHLVRARFREDGPCLHEFEYIIPVFAGATAGQDAYPLKQASCSLISDSEGTIASPRKIEGLRKVVLDWISKSFWAENQFRVNADIETDIHSSYEGIRNQLPQLEIEKLGKIVDLLLLGLKEPNRRPELNPDSWQKDPKDWCEDRTGQALIELAVAATLMGLLTPPDISFAGKCHTGKSGELFFAVLDGGGYTPADSLVNEYCNWIGANFGDMVGKSTLVLLTRLERIDLPENLAQEVCMSISDTTRQEEKELKEELRQTSQSILDDGTKIHWYPSARLRSAFDCTTLEVARGYLEGQLAPVFPS